MSRHTNPTEIARETLKQLALRRITPTPEQYREIYNEIAGVDDSQAGPHPLVKALVQNLKKLPKMSPEVERHLGQIEQAAMAYEWQHIPPLVIKCVELQGGQAALTRTWAELIHELITQWERRSPHYNTKKKSETLGKVLLNFGNYPSLLNEKLDALLRGWAEGASDLVGIETVEQAASVDFASDLASSEMPDYAGSRLQPSGEAQPGMDWQPWREILVRTLQVGVADRLSHYPELKDEAVSLTEAVTAVTSEKGLDHVAVRLKKFWIKLELQTEREQRLTKGLVNLLMLLVDNLSDLVGQEAWVTGQIEVVRAMLGEQLSMRRLYDIETGFKDVLYKQGLLRHSLDEAQAKLKDMIALFIDRLGSMADSTGGYHDKVSGYAEKIQAASDIPALKQVLDELMQDTRHMQLDMKRSHDELVAVRQQAQTAEQRIHELESELRSISEKVREDQLTGALNRRGLDDAFSTELARASRNGTPLCLSLLDIDNFKKLNDRFGHQTGDEALIHLVRVVKETIRPTDLIARYGGEEFVILLPDTPLEEAESVMRRVQRDLTKRFFLHNNERILITFSAGVTIYYPGESQEDAIERADQGMYQAKKSGKNQVVSVPGQATSSAA
ncbi:sensor domain-containing diguanylate cyclase [Parachitinimonas caeni]|uniref:diguanylate cyclase n=1 Tax=Parachitinimonas caeni TaxID=3031301 RepID=A0ABT7DX77_9NEIS|nr:GGDEF domain-containing protein [Parachitinimonas caeni]MDK2124671.1 GGDEF domain-containing protein [Parachitinimonas caeni]